MNAQEAMRRLRMSPQGGILVECLSTLINEAIAEHAHDNGPDGSPPMAGYRTIYSTLYPFPVPGSHEEPSGGPLRPSGTYEDFVAHGGPTTTVESLQAEAERLGRLIAEWWSDPDNPPADVVPVAQRWRPDLFLLGDPPPVTEPNAEASSHGASPPTSKRPGKEVKTPPQVCDEAAEALAAVGLPGYSPLSIVEGIEALALWLRRTRDQLAVAQASTRQHLEASSHRAQIAEHYRAALQHLVEFTDGDDLSRNALADLPEWDQRIRP